METAEEVLHDLAMPRLGGADVIVVADGKVAQHRTEADGHLVHELLGGDAALLGGLLDLLAVLVEPRQEVHLASGHAGVAGDHVGQHLLIGMAQVRSAVGVVDRGGDVEGARHDVPVRD